MEDIMIRLTYYWCTWVDIYELLYSYITSIHIIITLNKLIYINKTNTNVYNILNTKLQFLLFIIQIIIVIS